MIAGSGIEEGSGGLLSKFVVTLVKHAADQVANHAGTIVTNSALGSLLVLPKHHHAGACGLLVGGDSHEGLLVAGNVVFGTGTGILNGLAAVEILVDFSLDGIHVDVADNHHGLQVGAIPVVVETGDDGTLESADDLLQADRQTVGILRALQHDGPSGLAQTLLGAQTAAPLLEDDAALVLNLVVVEEELAGPAVEDFETHLDEVGIVGGELDVVDSLVERSPGVDAAAELDTVLLQGADHLVALVVLGTVESHVLAEVSQTLLVVVLQHRACIGHQAELYAVLRLLVGADVIGHAVGQLADFNLFVDRHLGGEVALLFLGGFARLGKRHAAGKHQKQHYGQKSFHCFVVFLIVLLLLLYLNSLIRYFVIS